MGVIVKKLILGITASCSLVASPASAASFIGDTFEGTYRFPTLDNTTRDGGTQVVDPSASFRFPTGNINPTATITASNVLVTFEGDGKYKDAEFSGILLRNISSSNIASFVLVSSTVVGFDQSNLSFTSNSLMFDFADLRIKGTDQISADVTFLTSSVPEPATWAMMVLGLGAAGFAMRRRKKGLKEACARVS